MEKSFGYFLKSFETIFRLFLQGKFLLFFLPGLIISILYWYWTSGPSIFEQSAESTSDIPLIGWMISGSFSFMDGMMDKIYEITYSFILLVLLSPFNTVLSERLDTHLTGRKFESGIIELINDVLRAIMVVIIAIVLEYSVMLLYFVLGAFIPGAIEQFLDPIMYFLIAAFFMGFSFYDYSLERYRFGTFGSLGYAFSRMTYMILAGGTFLLLLKIPYVGIILAPVLATMLSTLLYLQRENKITTQQIEGQNDTDNNASLS